MSSEFEDRLRRAREILPSPDAESTRRARELALRSLRRPRRKLPSALSFVSALLLTTALGFGLGVALAPSVSAAPKGLDGVGFLPANEWFVLQSGAGGGMDAAAFAIAANVPIHPADSGTRRLEFDGLPYSTLRALPSAGVVVVASFIPTNRSAHIGSVRFPSRTLPLQVRDATSEIQFGVQVRPRRPLGQYQLRATVDGYEVDLHIYYGRIEPSPAHLTAAQRQIDRLIVRSGGDADSRRRVVRQVIPPAAAPARVIDRTLLCPVEVQAGVRKLNVYVQAAVAGQKDLLGNKALAHAQLTTGSSIQGTVLVGSVAGAANPVLRSGSTLGINRRDCRASTVRIPLSSRGLVGGAASPFGDGFECFPGRRILIRVRASFGSPTSLRLDQRIGILSTRALVREVQFRAVTETGRPLVFASLLASGKARVYTGTGCVAD